MVAASGKLAELGGVDGRHRGASQRGQRRVDDFGQELQGAAEAEGVDEAGEDRGRRGFDALEQEAGHVVAAEQVGGVEDAAGDVGRADADERLPGSGQPRSLWSCSRGTCIHGARVAANREQLREADGGHAQFRLTPVSSSPARGHEAAATYKAVDEPQPVVRGPSVPVRWDAFVAGRVHEGRLRAADGVEGLEDRAVHVAIGVPGRVLASISSAARGDIGERLTLEKWRGTRTWPMGATRPAKGYPASGGARAASVDEALTAEK